jgi:hypothetical protein
MGADEEGTLARLKAHRRELVDPKIAEHRGHIVKTTGDGLLAEFASVVDAVRCAVECQRDMAVRNAGVPPDRRIEFRVGVNLGDIISEEGDIFGDGVNVAARLEALAEPGGICVNRAVRDQVRDKVDLAFEDLGEQQVKNIARPVRAYRVVTDAALGLAAAAPGRRRQVPRWVVAAGIAGLVLGASGAAAFWRLYQPHHVAPTAASPPPTSPTLPVKPSIAVLPFANLSGDPAQDYLADGLTENLLDALAQNPGLFVIARNATLDYRGKAVAPQAAAKDLGVRYVLEGSVQKSGDRAADRRRQRQSSPVPKIRPQPDQPVRARRRPQSANRGCARRPAEGRDDSPRLGSRHAQPRSLGEPGQSEPDLLSLQSHRRG